jgi:hypothetical protein
MTKVNAQQNFDGKDYRRGVKKYDDGWRREQVKHRLKRVGLMFGLS